MHKRILCVVLTAILIISLIPAMALPSRAVSDMATSDACIAILKAMEGFVKYPMYDNGQYSVGYGSGCEKDDYPDGITEEEADALLREYLATMEEDLNGFIGRHNLVFSQNQFDALMLFTYNCGIGWMYGEGAFRAAVLSGATGNTFIHFISQWSSASGQLHMGLVNRRLIEADMYLNGSYENKKPASYTYVLYDGMGSEDAAKVQGYDCNLPAFVRSQPTRSGYIFLGWYSEAEGGSWIRELSSENAEQTLYAHWQGSDASYRNAAKVSYQIPAGTLVSMNTYSAPNGVITGSLNGGAQVQILGDYVDSSDMKWGKISDGTWVKLGDPRLGTLGDNQSGGDQESGVEVTVTGGYVNVRSGPGTNYNVVSAVKKGDVLTITETTNINGILWGKFRSGWLCLEYTDYSGGLTPDDPEGGASENNPAAKPIASGTVMADTLNVRAAAGTHATAVGFYKKGDKVDIYEQTQVNGTPWGRTEKGWICLNYVLLDETVPETEPTEPENTEPENEKPKRQDNGVRNSVPGTVISQTSLNIRKDAGTNFEVVGSYASGEKILILEQKTVDGVAWGRTDKGWVCMQYVRLEDTWINEAGVVARVDAKTGLSVRYGPGLGYSSVTLYDNGSRILILEQTVIAGEKWGRTEQGWVNMEYVRLDQSAEVPQAAENNSQKETDKQDSGVGGQGTAVVGTVTVSGLNIRTAPTSGGKICGSYHKDQRVVILEQRIGNGKVWGRTDKGWINLAYVKLDSAEDGQLGRKVTVTGDMLRIRRGPGSGNAIVGSYLQGAEIVILETVRVGGTTWGRTDRGWICMDYVK